MIVMSSRPISATAAYLIETSRLRRRYDSEARVRADTSALSIPVTLILRWDDCPTRPVKLKAQDQRLYVFSKARKCLTTSPISQLQITTEKILTEKLSN
ncbi:unnamed protein product, partial [Brenthis ino]